MVENLVDLSWQRTHCAPSTLSTRFYNTNTLLLQPRRITGDRPTAVYTTTHVTFEPHAHAHAVVLATGGVGPCTFATPSTFDGFSQPSNTDTAPTSTPGRFHRDLDRMSAIHDAPASPCADRSYGCDVRSFLSKCVSGLLNVWWNSVYVVKHRPAHTAPATGYVCQDSKR